MSACWVRLSPPATSNINRLPAIGRKGLCPLGLGSFALQTWLLCIMRYRFRGFVGFVSTFCGPVQISSGLVQWDNGAPLAQLV